MIFFLIYVSGSLGDLCSWSNWTEWSQCTATCGGKLRSRTRNCQCPDSKSIPDCSGTSEELQYCISDCVRPSDYWKWHSQYSSNTEFKKPWPISENTQFRCANGYDNTRASASWYDILSGHSADDIWALLVDQYISALLNIQTGSPDDNLIDILYEAEDIIEDCDGWPLEKYNRAQELVEDIQSYNNGQMGVNSCQETPCCFYDGWGSWGECTSQCGGGLRYREEQCYCPAFHGGIPDDSWCPGTQLVQTEPCNINPCTGLEPVETESTELETLENTISNPDQIDCIPEDWSECSQTCNGFKWRLNTCSCLENSPQCSFRQYLNCDIDLTCDHSGENNQSMICNWTGWEPWTICSLDCDGIRTRRQLCFCDNHNELYDDSFCTGVPQSQSEPCNIDFCKTDLKPLQYWQTYNIYRSGEYYKPWPIPETTLFECNIGSSNNHSQLNWFQILNEENTQNNQWITLAQEYILIKLNIANGHKVDSNLQQVLLNTESILKDCDGFSGEDKEVAILLTQILKDNNNGIMNTTVMKLETLSYLLGQNNYEMGPHPSTFSPAIISLVSVGIVLLVVISTVIYYAWRKWKTSRDNIVMLAPEFDLPEPDEEIVPENKTEVYLFGDEEELSYELGELDEVVE